jgi:hypothetical protein
MKTISKFKVVPGTNCKKCHHKNEQDDPNFCQLFKYGPCHYVRFDTERRIEYRSCVAFLNPNNACDVG